MNQNSVFIPQGTNYTCTLASATMMLRRRAILEERDNWATITEASVGSVAWVPNVGLRFQFPYGGIYHCNAIWPGQAAKKEYFIDMLKQHPEGIVIYRTDNAQWHAVLLTDYDYDESSGTFYCADPAPGYASLGRIPLTSCSILKGGSQDAKINSISQIWYISDAAIKTLSSLRGTLHCPVEMLLVIGDERLDSRGVMGTITNSDGTISLTATGSGANREISFVIPGEYVKVLLPVRQPRPLVPMLYVPAPRLLHSSTVRRRPPQRLGQIPLQMWFQVLITPMQSNGRSVRELSMVRHLPPSARSRLATAHRL